MAEKRAVFMVRTLSELKTLTVPGYKGLGLSRGHAQSRMPIIPARSSRTWERQKPPVLGTATAAASWEEAGKASKAQVIHNLGTGSHHASFEKLMGEVEDRTKMFV